MHVLDIRELAQDWRDEIEDGVSFDTRKYEALAEQLGIAADPDALEAYGDDYEPTMIAERDFAEYAQELAEDVFPFSSSSEAAQVIQSWPYRCIDWEQAARELAYDYSTVTFDGTDYYIRAC